MAIAGTREFYIVPRTRGKHGGAGKFEIRTVGSQGPRGICPSKDLAIARARKLDPAATVFVERADYVYGRGRDRWEMLEQD